MEQTGEYRQFATVLEEVEGNATLRVFGDIDLACAAEFEHALHNAATGSGTLVVDLQECQYMDSTGLTALVRAVKQHGDRVRAVALEGSSVARVMEMTGFHDVLPITLVKATRAMREHADLQARSAG